MHLVRKKRTRQAASDSERIARQTGSRRYNGLSRQAADNEKNCATDRQQTVIWTKQAGSRR